jgi:hypothetical protein
MPRIRSQSFSYESITTDAGLTIPMCTSQIGDLLLVFVMADSSVGTFSCSNGSGSWTQLFNRLNTCDAACFWKISNVANEGDIVITNPNTETYNGIVIAIEDVDQTTPIASYIDEAAASAVKVPVGGTLETLYNNSIVIAFLASSTLAAPCFIEGIVHHIGGGEGPAQSNESMGVGWYYQQLAGVTATVTGTVLAAGAGVKATLEIAGPIDGGPAIIPTYTVSDSSRHIDFINGITAFNSNAALAATADTTFGTVFTGSKGLYTGVDATVAAAADVGVNSFHAFARLTNTASINRMSGAELVLTAANRFNIGTRNLLAHLRPQTPASYQTIATLSSERGVWMGIRSNTGSGGATTGYEIFQVFGDGAVVSTNDTKFPIIINPSAIPQFSSGTIDTGVITSVGFWTSAKGALTSVWEFGQVWLLDKITIAGGNAAYPIKFKEIQKTVADSHERVTAVQQGANQLILYQDVQIGNGGTDPFYLNLDGTALEFPKLYSVSEGFSTYNSVPNKIGLTYYPGPGDTVIHKNSIISSPSRYFWGFNNSSSIDQPLDLNGLSVIGAGDVSLNIPYNIDGVTFNDFTTIYATGAKFVDCIFTNVFSGKDGIRVTTGTSFTNCVFDTTLIQAVPTGYLFSTTNPSIISGCSFAGGGGHAFRVTSTGTFNFRANTFSNYGASGLTSAAIYNDSSGLVTLNILEGGSTPTFKNGTNATTSIVAGIKNLTFTNIVTGSEIRLYTAGTTGEVYGVEDTTTSNPVYQYTNAGSIDIVVHNLRYQYYRVTGYALPAADSSFQVTQIFDRNYDNPV